MSVYLTDVAGDPISLMERLNSVEPGYRHQQCAVRQLLAVREPHLHRAVRDHARDHERYQSGLDLAARLLGPAEELPRCGRWPDAVLALARGRASAERPQGSQARPHADVRGGQEVGPG